MTPQEAIQFLKETKAGCITLADHELREVCTIAIEAILKQIPMNPNGDLHSVPHYRCRNCHNSVVTFCDDKHFPHCQWCGQALDWSDN